jgi:hypothetical protein
LEQAQAFAASAKNGTTEFVKADTAGNQCGWSWGSDTIFTHFSSKLFWVNFCVRAPGEKG